ncbi:hypothetical protein UF75_2254 [Desulfosporosinus sp. I2]|uniref:hypothetical protein n=1 Tax=Desulfosporosinus sp. I2 TaxID=1617025 RepID=UPI0005EE3165|nr:hypothetical protein [Desulfosporosinus sp. I2]KJR47341.1 hypothetical protein UF75_2254 [Desulfosporosinus sp. I2]
MAKSIKASSCKAASGRKEYLSSIAGNVLSQKTNAYGISSNSKKASLSIKVSQTMSATSASKVLSDGRFGAESKSIAGSVLAQTKKRCSTKKKKRK